MAKKTKKRLSKTIRNQAAPLEVDVVKTAASSTLAPRTAMSTNVTDWFDITDKKHILAWWHLSQTGEWPLGFIPEDVACIGMWQVILASRLAMAYTRVVLEES